MDKGFPEKMYTL